MNPKKLVRYSNIIGIVSIILLVYWVFTFITIQVFGLKIFKENLTQSFYLSVLGILALMTGALMINVMFNLTRIAQKHNNDTIVSTKNKKIRWIILLSFPLLLTLLFSGDYLTAKKKEKLLVESAKSLIKTNSNKNQHLLNYTFDEKWLIKTSDMLSILSKTDKNFPKVSILIKDKIDKDPVYLEFKNYYRGNLRDTILPVKMDFIKKTSNEEREYLKSVFKNKNKKYRYSAHDGDYELFYPYSNGNKTIIIYFSEYQRYGKFGS